MENTNLIIGIHGAMGSGKGTTAKYIAEYFFNNKIDIYYKMFALPLKEIVEHLTGIKMKFDYDNHFTHGILDYSQDQKETYVPCFDMTIGQMLQKIGTDLFRDNFDEDTWIKTLFNVDYPRYENRGVYLISDVRFENEAEIIKEKGGIVINVVGEHHFNSNRDPKHKSEKSMNDYKNYDYILKNTSTLDFLRKQIFSPEFDKLIKEKINEKNTKSTL